MKKSAPHSQVAIAPCSHELNAARPSEIQLAPAGVFRARDGRPANLPGWKLDDTTGPAVAARAALRKTPPVIDYEHQTLATAANGQPAPAAGWIKDITWRSGEGLFATAEWTPRAAEMIAAKEYRFISPVFKFDPATGDVLGIEMAAITNNPALDGMREIELRAAAKFELDSEDPDVNPILAALLTMLKLSHDATEAQATAALKALQESVAAKDTEIVALKAKAPDPSKFVPIDTVQQLQAQVAALSAAESQRAVDDLVKGALEDGRLLPAMETWARDLGKSDLAALKAYVEAAQPIAALTGTQTGGKPRGEQDGRLGAEDLAVCSQLGIDTEAYQKANKKVA